MYFLMVHHGVNMYYNKLNICMYVDVFIIFGDLGSNITYFTVN